MGASAADRAGGQEADASVTGGNEKKKGGPLGTDSLKLTRAGVWQMARLQEVSSQAMTPWSRSNIRHRGILGGFPMLDFQDSCCPSYSPASHVLICQIRLQDTLRTHRSSGADGPNAGAARLTKTDRMTLCQLSQYLRRQLIGRYPINV